MQQIEISPAVSLRTPQRNSFFYPTTGTMASSCSAWGAAVMVFLIRLVSEQITGLMYRRDV